VFHSLSSPWAHLGYPRLLDIAARHDAELVIRPIKVITDNGGILLGTRPEPRKDYHALELDRWRIFLALSSILNQSIIRQKTNRRLLSSLRPNKGLTVAPFMKHRSSLASKPSGRKIGKTRVNLVSSAHQIMCIKKKSFGARTV
jgi:2-hydroxychromene-2-carboxylate isomerase